MATAVGQFAEATRRAFGFLRALDFRETVAEFWSPGDFPARARAIAAEPSAPLGAGHVCGAA